MSAAPLRGAPVVFAPLLFAPLVGAPAVDSVVTDDGLKVVPMRVASALMTLALPEAGALSPKCVLPSSSTHL